METERAIGMEIKDRVYRTCVPLWPEALMLAACAAGSLVTCWDPIRSTLSTFSVTCWVTVMSLGYPHWQSQLQLRLAQGPTKRPEAV